MRLVLLSQDEARFPMVPTLTATFGVKGTDDALRDHPHLEFYRLPRYSPQLNPIERLWRVLRRGATHNRLFGTLADLRRSIRNSLSYYQTMRQRVRTLLNGRPRKQTPLPGS